MEKEKDGVWRTIRGRRVFIRSGESLGSAMSRSGKFKREDIREGKKDEILSSGLRKKLKNDNKYGDKKDYKIDRKISNKIEKRYPSIVKDNQAEKNRINENAHIEGGGKTRIQRYWNKYSEADRTEHRHELIQKKLAEYNYGRANEDLEKNSKEWENRFNEGKNNFSDLDKQRKEIVNRLDNARLKGNVDTQEKHNKIIADYKAKKQSNNKIEIVEGKQNADVWNAKEKKNYINVNGKDYEIDTDLLNSKQIYNGDNVSLKVKDGKVVDYQKQSNNKVETEKELYERAKNNPDSIDPMTENSTDWEALEKKYGKQEKIKKYVEKKKGKSDKNSWLPKETEIKEQGKSNRKEVSENIQAHILSYYDKPEDFISQMDVFSNLPTNWHRGEEIAKGGSYLIYNGDMADFLDKLKINPKGKKFSEDKSFQMYTSLIGRESAKLYDRIKKHQNETIKNYKKKKGK